MKRLLSILMIIGLIASITVYPVFAADTTTPAEEEDIAASTVNYGTYWVNPGTPTSVWLGSLSYGDVIELYISSNPYGYPISAQLYTAYGANYASRTLTTGSVWWYVSATASDYRILLNNDNNYATQVTLYVYKY